MEFTGDAVSNVFRLTVTVADSSAYNKSKDVDTGKDATGEASLVFKVVEGYNAYNLADLSLFDNHKSTDSVSDGYVVDWTDERENLTTENADASKGIVLHNDISITEADLGEENLWTEEDVDNYLAVADNASDFQSWKNEIGFASDEAAKAAIVNTPEDYLNIFLRNTHNGTDTSTSSDSFVLEGNFREVSIKGMKPNVFSRNDTAKKLSKFLAGDGSHSQLFGINSRGTGATSIAASEEDTVTINNLQMTGNGSIASSATATDLKLAKGGFIGVKTGYCTLNTENTISNGTFIAFMSETHGRKSAEGDVTFMNLNRAKAYDAYSSALYLYGSDQNVITDSWFTRAGGPLVFMDESNRGDWTNPDIRSSAAKCYNTYLYNAVAGNEPWFADHEGSSGLVQSYMVDAGAVSYKDTGELDTDNSGWIGQYAASAYANGLTSAKTITQKATSAGTTINKINFIALDVNASHFADNVYQALGGKFDVYHSYEKDGDGNITADLTASLDMSLVVKNSYNTTPLVPTTLAPIICQSSNDNAIGYIDGSTMTPVVANTASFASGDYMSYYLDPAAGSGVYNGYLIGAFLGTYNFADYWLPNV